MKYYAHQSINPATGLAYDEEPAVVWEVDKSEKIVAIHDDLTGGAHDEFVGQDMSEVIARYFNSGHSRFAEVDMEDA